MLSSGRMLADDLQVCGLRRPRARSAMPPPLSRGSGISLRIWLSSMCCGRWILRTLGAGASGPWRSLLIVFSGPRRRAGPARVTGRALGREAIGLCRNRFPSPDAAVGQRLLGGHGREPATGSNDAPQPPTCNGIESLPDRSPFRRVRRGEGDGQARSRVRPLASLDRPRQPKEATCILSIASALALFRSLRIQRLAFR